VVPIGEFDGDVITESRRTVTDIDDDIENGSVDAADILAHRRIPLEVQPTDDPAPRSGLNGLLEVRRHPLGFEVPFDPRLQEETARVGKRLGLQQLHTLHLRFADAHV
jgi:hypothetical protein